MALKFPSFSVSIDDSDDTLVPIGRVPRGALAEYDETKHTARLCGQAAVLQKILGTGRPVMTRSKKKKQDQAATARTTETEADADTAAPADGAPAVDPVGETAGRPTIKTVNEDEDKDKESIKTDYINAELPPSWRE